MELDLELNDDKTSLLDEDDFFDGVSERLEVLIRKTLEVKTLDPEFQADWDYWFEKIEITNPDNLLDVFLMLLYSIKDKVSVNKKFIELVNQIVDRRLYIKEEFQEILAWCYWKLMESARESWGALDKIRVDIEALNSDLQNDDLEAQLHYVTRKTLKMMIELTGADRWLLMIERCVDMPLKIKVCDKIDEANVSPGVYLETMREVHDRYDGMLKHLLHETLAKNIQKKAELKDLLAYVDLRASKDFFDFVDQMVKDKIQSMLKGKPEKVYAFVKGRLIHKYLSQSKTSDEAEYYSAIAKALLEKARFESQQIDLLVSEISDVIKELDESAVFTKTEEKALEKKKKVLTELKEFAISQNSIFARILNFLISLFAKKNNK
jgi:hypothetical protein